MKTIKEGLDEAYKNSGENAYFSNGFVAGVEFSQRWIPVEEELPETDEILYPCIVKAELNRIKPYFVYEIANFDKRDKQFHYRGMAKTIKYVTYWRPIELK